MLISKRMPWAAAGQTALVPKALAALQRARAEEGGRRLRSFVPKTYEFLECIHQGPMSCFSTEFQEP